MLSDLGHDYNSDFVIDPSEVDIHLSKIKIHKAPGPDGISNWLLRHFSQLLCHPLAVIFSASTREGFFPPIWKSADVVAIPKVHPPTSIQNDLRPITFLPTVAKLLEGIVKDWLLPSLDPILDQNQFGCRPGSIFTNARWIQHTLSKNIDKVVKISRLLRCIIYGGVTSLAKSNVIHSFISVY